MFVMGDPLIAVWQSYGWLGFLGYVMVREVWPFVQNRVWPARVKKAHQEQERLNRMEERQIVAIEEMGKSVHAMAQAITTNNERLSQLIAAQSVHGQETSGAIALMRERTGSPEKKRRTTKRSE